MMTEWKRCIKLMKYSLHPKLSMIAGICSFMLGFGIVCMCKTASNFALGSLYMLLMLVMVVERIQTSMAAGISLSSPRIRYVQTVFLDWIHLLLTLVIYAASVGIAWFKVWNEKNPDLSAVYGRAIVYVGIFEAIFVIYTAIVYKNFGIGLIVLMCSSLYIFLDLGKKLWTTVFPVHIVSGSICGFLFLIVGFAISAILRRMLYRKPLSKYAVRMERRK